MNDFWVSGSGRAEVATRRALSKGAAPAIKIVDGEAIVFETPSMFSPQRRTVSPASASALGRGVADSRSRAADACRNGLGHRKC